MNYQIAVGVCNAHYINELIRYDHHIVAVNHRKGILITYHLDRLPINSHIIIVFEYIQEHPVAPAFIQQIIDKITFTQKKVDEKSIKDLPQLIKSIQSNA